MGTNAEHVSLFSWLNYCHMTELDGPQWKSLGSLGHCWCPLCDEYAPMTEHKSGNQNANVNTSSIYSTSKTFWPQFFFFLFAKITIKKGFGSVSKPCSAAIASCTLVFSAFWFMVKYQSFVLGVDRIFLQEDIENWCVSTQACFWIYKWLCMHKQSQLF